MSNGAFLDCGQGSKIRTGSRREILGGVRDGYGTVG